MSRLCKEGYPLHEGLKKGSLSTKGLLNCHIVIIAFLSVKYLRAADYSKTLIKMTLFSDMSVCFTTDFNRKNYIYSEGDSTTQFPTSTIQTSVVSTVII